jgi:proteasome lid subunit RPN8/RPN11
MRQIKIGIDLVNTFAKLSEENTNQNVETVAILAGVLMGSPDESNATNNTKFGELVVRAAPNGLSRSRGAQSEEEKEFFIVTHLIVPEQQGTHDTCEVLNDEVMPGLLAEYGLVQLGWIHVHPRYEAFLSSVDLHTHFSYQMMLPESIAIVWAPIASPNYGIFSLTPKGMRDIEKCDQRGFHTHPEGEAFTSSTHVRQDYNLPPIRVLDLRHDPSSSSSDEHSEHSKQ